MRALRCIKKTRKSGERGCGVAHAHTCGFMADDDDFDVGGCGGNDNHNHHLKCHNF
jgi:hypothetical protein